MGPLTGVSAMNVMWLSFYSIGLMMLSIGVIYLVRNKIKNVFISFLLKLIAYVMFGLGSLLMVLIVATWPA